MELPYQAYLHQNNLHYVRDNDGQTYLRHLGTMIDLPLIDDPRLKSVE